ncbi:MAG TPA: TIGR02391 family protein [Acidimicrobiales bacterium]|nr:TIGR02391 family protein [Acidimicrobiales bacterium]
MDAERAIRHLEAFLGLLRTNRAAFSLRDQIFASNTQWRETQEEILSRRPLIIAIAQELDDTIAAKMRGRAAHPWEWQDLEEAAAEALGLLRDRDEFQAVLGRGHVGSVGRIHGAIWRNAASSWQEAQFGQALQAAVTFVLGTMLPNKLERFDLAGFDLVREAFSLEPPKPGRPRLRLPMVAPDTEAWVMAHSGAGHLGVGCAQVVRGLVTRELDYFDEASAFELLMTLSALARWIDQANVERARSG